MEKEGSEVPGFRAKDDGELLEKAKQLLDAIRRIGK